MKKLLFSCCVLSIAFMYGVGFCTYTGESPERESPSSGNSLFTKYEDDVLSVDIKDVPLGEVLQKLSDETGILFSFPPAIGEERVMVRFSNFKIADALNKILSSHDRIFIYEEIPPDSDESLPSKLKEVRIYTPPPKGTKKGSTSKSPAVINSTSSQPTQTAKNNNTVQRKTGKRPSARTRGKQTADSLAEKLKDSDYRVRLDTVRNLGRIGNADAIGHLTSALEDKNPEVRNEAKNNLEKIQENLSDKTQADTDDKDNTQPIEGTPTFDVGFLSQDSGFVDMVVNLSDVPEQLLTAGAFLEYDPSKLKVINADFQDGWDEGMSKKVPTPTGPGSYMLTTGNFSYVSPDESNGIGLANVQFECLTGDCSGETITVKPVPNYDTFVGKKNSVYDSNMTERNYVIP